MQKFGRKWKPKKTTMTTAMSRWNSTKKQSIARQIDNIKQVYPDAVLIQEAYTGTKMDRPEFTALLEKLSDGDRLVVTKLDRFARTASGGIETIRGLLARGVSIHILNMGLIDNTPTGRLMVTMLLGFAEFERDMIVERTQSGKAIAKATRADYREGRPEKEIDERQFQKFREKTKKRQMTVAEACTALGISRATWYNRVRTV